MVDCLEDIVFGSWIDR